MHSLPYFASRKQRNNYKLLKINTMKKILLYTAILSIVVLSSCGGGLGSSAVYESKDGIKSLIEQLKENYGPKAAFNSILMSYSDQIGNFISAQGNNDISSNKLVEKQLVNGTWKDNSEITVEITDGKMEDFLFTLEEVDVMKFPELVKDAKNRVKTEKGIEDVVATTASLIMPSTVSNKMKDLNYSITIEPKNGGTTFILTYDLSGKFLNMTY